MDMSFYEIQFVKVLEKATRQNRSTPDWDSVLQLCDLINEKKIMPCYGFLVMRGRLMCKLGNVQMMTLQVFESIVKNCGSHEVYSHLSDELFLQELRHLYKTSQDEVLLKKLKELMQTWALALQGFSDYRNLQCIVGKMTVEGVRFPEMHATDARKIIFRNPPKWSKEKNCHLCTVNVTFRRHHCRSCGMVFCLKCSSFSVKLPQFGLVENARACEKCFVEAKNYAERDKAGR